MSAAEPDCGRRCRLNDVVPEKPPLPERERLPNENCRGNPHQEKNEALLTLNPLLKTFPKPSAAALGTPSMPTFGINKNPDVF